MATILYYGEFHHYSYCENWIAAALDRNGHHCVRVQRTKWFDEMKLIAIARQTHARIVLLSKTPEVESAQLREIRKEGLAIVFWTFDWMRHPEMWKWYAPLAKEADICFQTDGHGDPAYKDEGIRRVELHQGCVPGLHDLPKNYDDIMSIVDLGADLTFIGSTYSDRRHQLMGSLEAHNLDLRKWGEPDGQLWGNDFARACYQSKIVIGDNFVNDVPGYWSDRVYLTLGCGGFFLTAYVPGLENEFENHKHLVWWKTFDELHELIKHYLPREGKRRMIALEGYRLVHREHTYDRRIQALTDALEKI